MEPDRMKQWLDLAKQFNQGKFWDSVFDADYTKQIMEQFGAPSAPERQMKTEFPKAELLKSGRELIVLIELPGVRKEDVELSIIDGSLHVKGRIASRFPDLQVILAERYLGEFERMIPLPESIAAGAKISAKYENGLLEIRLPRLQRPKESIRID